jgi:hypothetical protein
MYQLLVRVLIQIVSLLSQTQDMEFELFPKNAVMNLNFKTLFRAKHIEFILIIVR